MSLQATSASSSSTASPLVVPVKPINTLTVKPWQIIAQYLGRGPELTKFLRASKIFNRADYRLAAQVAIQILGQSQLQALELTLFPQLAADSARSSAHRHLLNLLHQRMFHQALNFVNNEAPEEISEELQQKVETFSKELFNQCLEGHLQYGGVTPTVIQLSPRAKRGYQIFLYMHARKMREQVPTAVINELIEIALHLPPHDADQALQFLLADLIGTGKQAQALTVIHDRIDWLTRPLAYSCIPACELSLQSPHISFREIINGFEQSPLHAIIYQLLSSNGHARQPYYYSQALPKTIHFLNDLNCSMPLKNELRSFACLCIRDRILSFIQKFNLDTYPYHLDLLDRIPADWPQGIKNSTRQLLVECEANARTLDWLALERGSSPLLALPTPKTNTHKRKENEIETPSMATQPSQTPATEAVPAQIAEETSPPKASNHKRKEPVEITIRTPTLQEPVREINTQLDQTAQIPSAIASTSAATASSQKRAKQKSSSN